MLTRRGQWHKKRQSSNYMPKIKADLEESVVNNLIFVIADLYIGDEQLTLKEAINNMNSL